MTEAPVRHALPVEAGRPAGDCLLPAGASPGRVLPREYYVSPEIYEQELEKVFRRQWLFLGHVSQVPEVGSFFVEELCGEGVIVVRESDDRISGFLNVCRHRGHPLCRTDHGTLRQFTCPYHLWTYGLDGLLKRAPGSPDGRDFDYADWPLHKVQVEVWNGFIFGWLSAEEAPSLVGKLQPDDGAFRRLRTSEVKEAFRESYDIKANWKLLLENYLECYHCAGSHPELCVTMDVGATYASTGNEWVGEYFGGHLQLKPGMRTGSLDGGLVSKPLADEAEWGDLPDGFGAGIGIVPALTRVIFHIDHGIVHLLRPIDVGAVRWQTRWYVRGDAVEGEDYALDKLIEVWRATNLQDIALCEGAYAGVRSHRFVPGPLHPTREAAISAALRQYLALMSR